MQGLGNLEGKGHCYSHVCKEYEDFKRSKWNGLDKTRYPKHCL